MERVFSKPLKTAVFFGILSMNVPNAAMAQDVPQEKFMDWYVGAGTGLNYSWLRFSDLKSDKFPTKEGHFSPVYSIFVQGEFGANRNYVVRPQLTYLTRGGKLTEIDKYDGYPDEKLNDKFYELNAKYLDLRIPVLYQFGNVSSSIRPYAGITATLGFAVGGDARLQQDYDDNSYTGYQVDLSSKNFSSTYFAIAPTVGVRFNFSAGSKGQNKLFAAIEASYEIGLTNTYGGDEMDGKVLDVVRKRNVPIDGTRKFSGFSIQALLGVPFSAFKRYKEPVQPVVIPRVVETAPAPTAATFTKPCYTLEEIETMMAKNEDVYGKTICAVADINFEFAKSDIMPSSYDYLNKLARILKQTNSKVIVKGHTDNVGTDEFNMKLSKNRAKAVMRYLVKHGVDEHRLSYQFYGSSLPLKSNDTEEGRTYNRRVEFELQR